MAQDDRQPTIDDIEARFAALVAGRISRDEADRWAARWIADDSLDWDKLSWWALGLLFGIDLPADARGRFLFSDKQVGDWLAELRKRRAQFDADTRSEGEHGVFDRVHKVNHELS